MEFVGFIVNSITNLIKSIKRRKRNFRQKKYILKKNSYFDGVHIKKIIKPDTVFEQSTKILYKFKWSHGRPKLVPIERFKQNKVIKIKRGNSKNNIYRTTDLIGRAKKQEKDKAKKQEKDKESVKKEKEEKPKERMKELKQTPIKKQKSPISDFQDSIKKANKNYSYFNIDSKILKEIMESDDPLIFELERLAVLESRHKEVINKVHENMHDELNLEKLSKAELMKLMVDKQKMHEDALKSLVKKKQDELKSYKDKLVDYVKKMQSIKEKELVMMEKKYLEKSSQEKQKEQKEQKEQRKDNIVDK